MNDLAYDRIFPALLEDIPELHEEYQREQSRWAPEDVPVHVFYGTNVAHFIQQLESSLGSSPGNLPHDRLRRCFLHIESLAASSDFQTRCVVQASLLETLIGEPGGWSRFHPYFGLHTNHLAEKVRRHFAG